LADAELVFLAIENSLVALQTDLDALVFPEHADNPEWEIGDSRISKLWVVS
jgi:hypothetical protein